jgi:hypothetical protein
MLIEAILTCKNLARRAGLERGSVQPARNSNHLPSFPRRVKKKYEANWDFNLFINRHGSK